MRRVEYTWDERKAHTNLLKHGVRFGAAVQVFSDPHAFYEHDRFVDGEERWRVVGWADAQLLLVAYITWDEDDDLEVYRLISARPATLYERRIYEEGT